MYSGCFIGWISRPISAEKKVVVGDYVWPKRGHGQSGQ
jgi:hypothetical protein